MKDCVEDKRLREQRVLEEMIRLYCRKQHPEQNGPGGACCPDCQALLDYAKSRSQKCPFMKEKTFCSNCKVHCYKPEMRQRIRQVIQITLISHLEKFNLTSLAGITQTDEMELGEIGERKTAVFAVIPDSDSSYNFIVGMLYTQLFQQLYRKADFEHGGRLPVHVHFVMDEFANVALPDDFDKLLATMRSREISVSIILQNLAQLKALFDKQWESIVGNCDTFLYLGGNEQSTHEYVSKLLGKQTIDTNTYGQSKGRSGSYTTNFQTAGRELMTPDEVRMLDNRYALLFIRGERPVKDLKYNILKHPNVALTTDGKAEAYQHGTDPLSVAAVSINLEKLKQAIPEDTDTGDYVVLTEEEVYDFMRKKAQENNQNQNSNYQEVTYEKHHPQHHSSHHPSDF